MFLSQKMSNLDNLVLRNFANIVSFQRNKINPIMSLLFRTRQVNQTLDLNTWKK